MEKETDHKLRWWGWGTVDESYPVEERPDYVKYLSQKLGITIDRLRLPDPDIGDLCLREPRINGSDVDALADVVGVSNISTAGEDRVRHAIGKSYRDVVRARMGIIENPPDAVVFPNSEKEIIRIMEMAEKRSFSLVPYCGGSSVVGGVEPLDGEGLSGSVSVDLRNMAELVAVDPESMTAGFQAGIQGPGLEHKLEEKDLYFGHAPESFYYSGLGGWIASRSAGRQSTGYGKIEEMVEAVRMVSPRGIVDTMAVPATAAGPELLRLICGSEGTLGIITEATLKVRARPEVFDYRGLMFREFEEGVDAVRSLMQAGIVPETIRISDGEETALAYRLMKRFDSKVMNSGMNALIKYLARRGYSFDGGSYSVIGCEGKESEVHARMNGILSECRRHGAIHLGRYAGNQWYRSRYDNPYLRDIMLGWGLMIDTLETATNWSNIMNLHREVKGAIRDAIADYGSDSIVTCHLSHSYRAGSSLYFIFIGRQAEGREIEQWEHVKNKAGKAIRDSGGTISHHHGIGYEHAPWFTSEYGEQGIRTLRQLKASFDPAGIMNPGKLGLSGY